MNPDPSTLASRDAAFKDHRLRLLLVSLLLAAYWLVYVGQPTTIDGSATLAVTASFLTHGTPDITVLGSAESQLPPLARMGTFGADGLLYAKKGVTPSLLLLPFVTLAEAIPFLPVRAAAMLLNPILTALTAVLLYTFARWLGYRPRTAFLAALIYGLGTFAIVYTLTLFGEPLAALLLLIALMGAHRYHEAGSWRGLVVAGGALGLALGVNLTYAVMIPWIALDAFGVNPRRWRIHPILALSVPLAGLIGLLLLYNVVRFGSFFESGYNFAAGEGFTTPFGLGLYGLLLSPYRGMAWYNPVLLLAIPGALQLRKRVPRLAILIPLLTAVQVVTYASWWSWHGGVVWGPRFLLPVTPLLVLLILPIIDRVPQQHGWTITLGFLGGLSLLIQVFAALFSFIPHIIYLYEQYASTVVDGFFIDYDPQVVYRLDASPVLAQFRNVLSGQSPQSAIFQQADGVHGLLLVLVLITGFGAYHYAQHKWQMAAATGLILVLGFGIAARQQSLTAIARAVTQNLLPADVVVAASTDYGENLIELKALTRVITTNAPTTPDDPLAAGLWRDAMQQAGLLWFINWFPPASPDNWQERDLWQRASFVREVPFNNNRALLFDLAPPAQADQPGGWQFGAIELADYGIQRADEGLRITLAWHSRTPPAQDYTWFVHLLDARGQIVQQQDRAPQGGFVPTSSWPSGNRVADYLFFPLDAATSTQDWQLRIGWVDLTSGDRLPTTDPQGQPLAENYALIPVG